MIIKPKDIRAALQKPPKLKKARTTINIDAVVKLEMEVLCKRQKITVSGLVERLLIGWIQAVKEEK